jgi:hypothetical protein
LKISRVRQVVNVDYAEISVVDELTNHGRADESGAAGDKDFFHGVNFT